MKPYYGLFDGNTTSQQHSFDLIIHQFDLLKKTFLESRDSNPLFFTLSNDQLDECEKILNECVYAKNLECEYRIELKNLNDSFKAKVKEIIEFEKIKLLNLESEQNEYGLQSGPFTYANQQAIAIAKLLNASNRIRFGLIPMIKEVFFEGTPRNALNEYTVRQLDHLLAISRGEKPQDKTYEDFKKIKKPGGHLADETNQVIRVTVNKSGHEDLFDQDARTTALAAVLKMLRQKETRTCYTEREKGVLNGLYVDSQIKDIKQTFKHGQIYRYFAESVLATPIQAGMADPDMENVQHKINTKGMLIERCKTHLNIFNAPGIQKAMRIMAIEDKSDLRKKILELLFITNEIKEVSITVKQLIDAIVKAAGKENSSNSINQQGYAGFSSMTYNALHRAQIAQLATMPQITPDSAFKGYVTKCVEKSLGKVIENLPIHLHNLSEVYIDEHVLGTIKHQLLIRFESMVAWRYENLGNVNARGDQEINDGQFVLCTIKNDGKGHVTLKSVNSPEEFQKLVENAFKKAWQYGQLDRTLPVLESKYKPLFDLIMNEVKKPSFLKDCFVHYRDNIIHPLCPVADWKNLPHTPIRDKDGGTVLGTLAYNQCVIIPEPFSIYPESPEEALQQLSNWSKENCKMESDRSILPMVIPAHATNFFSSAKLNDNDVVIKLKEVGQGVGEVEMSESMQLFVAEGAFGRITNAEKKKEAEAEFKEKLQGVTNRTVQEFGKLLCETVQKFTPKSEYLYIQDKVCESMLDGLAKFHADKFKILATSAVQVFDLNWVDEGQLQRERKMVDALTGAFYMDPIFQEIRLAGCTYGGTAIYPIQSMFLANPGKDQWKIFNIPPQKPVRNEKEFLLRV